MKRVIIIESIVIIILLCVIGISMVHNCDDNYDYNVNGNQKNILVKNEATAIKISKTVLNEYNVPIGNNIMAKDLGNYWRVSESDNSEYCLGTTMYIRKADGCIVYCNMYGADDIPEDMIIWSRRDFELMEKDILRQMD